MATYFTDDFADFATDWTNRYNTDSPDFSVSGGNLVYPDGKATDWVAWTWNDVEDTNHANIEFLGKLTYASSDGAASYPFIVRGSGADESVTAYVLYLFGGANRIRISYCSASDTPVEVASSTAVTIDASGTYWIRFRVNGSGPTTVQARIWADGGGEPGTWTIDTTAASGPTTAGWNGVATFNNNASNQHTLLQLGVGTNGDTAPSSAGSGASADLAATGNSGTFSGTANSPATATLAQTGGSGTLSASAGAGASAALAATGDSGTLAASAYTPALASLAATGASGIFVGSAFSEATAALSATGGSGTLSASAGAEASASLAATGGSGTLAAEAFVQAVATLAATGVSGSLIASAWTTISASLAATGGSGELSATAGEPVVATRVLSSYRPLPPPADPKDFGQWAMNELLTIARHLADGRDFDLLNTIHAPPSKPREGMAVHADGTNWDPGSGAGRYERVGGAWVKL